MRTILPTLLSFNSFGALEELPLETLALQQQRILILDHQSQILIWSGTQVAGPQYDAYRAACLDRALSASLYRFPRPEILLFNQGSSAARWLQVRLAPSHKDTQREQDTHFPQIAGMPQEMREALVKSFLPTDEPSFLQYFRGLFAEQKRSS